MDKFVPIRCKGSMDLDISELNHFQGSLKELSVDNYEKLKSVILELGFSEPISVWKDGKGKWQTLNGHQRLRCLIGLREEGYEVPKIPVTVVEAKDEAEAKKKVLTLTSQYGEITNQGLYEFLETSGVGFDWAKGSLRLPEINLQLFEEGFFGGSSPSADGSVDLTSNDFSGEHVCPKCGFEFSDGKISEAVNEPAEPS